MVKGGTKRKPAMKKITNKASRATTFTKRRDGLFSKAAQLCVLSDARIAILATPSSSNSNASFFSFGHSSVDSVVSAYLSGQRIIRLYVRKFATTITTTLYHHYLLQLKKKLGRRGDGS
ncbi:hypothetical protein Bca4012_035340 [Brassica carinata]|uniref:MADS-box domain-containing protein n=1 Tax=Brassica carinata TaxID=52824 RepID=A0A8X7WAF8_BRACI|nr:hypothetical protein Bca52824_009104 [Brassica carinata]